MATTENTVPSGPSNFPSIPPPPSSGQAQPSLAQKRLQQTQAQVDEVVGIMKVNVEKVLERDQKLTELDQRADALQHGASQFEQQAQKLKRKHWWANIKMMIVMGVIGVVLLIIIIVLLFN
ncbi:synaptobrevin-like isoform X3 [Condylostylus longicornis]|uniref:synaptobrevin-like isoform X3 n=1 Tax=Condylostylus longicornis TaxID=2530218 RepID=UPI00244E418B|nr:synaptobrevin-like isoform X3 [Condylostylus longicornis]